MLFLNGFFFQFWASIEFMYNLMLQLSFFLNFEFGRGNKKSPKIFCFCTVFYRAERRGTVPIYLHAYCAASTALCFMREWANLSSQIQRRTWWTPSFKAERTSAVEKTRQTFATLLNHGFDGFSSKYEI